MIRLKRAFISTLVVAIILSFGWTERTWAQEGDEQITRLMERMSIADKVGQLFLVTFPGSEVTEDAVITELIRDYRVGGVLLLPENDNIINEGDTLTQVSTLARRLQRMAWQVRVVTGTVESQGGGPFIPLFIAVNHEGNGMPFTGIVNGTTPLPSQMALGATWNPDYAEAVGQIAGQELHALGINMLLGPSLDVLEKPRPESSGDLGVRSLGGEPFWVGQMGLAYIRGVHEGTEGRMAVVAKHFPGLGASDRSPDEEVSTVQRTLEKLRQVDLSPFFTVAQAEDPLARPDGVLVSHIRFRGLEGGRFTTTGPISVDGQVLQRLLGLSEMVSWREQGGLTVSDELGLRALKRFYDPNEGSFNGRRIAQDAFLAGNDLLLLSQFALSDDWEDQVANIKSTITFFQEKYEADPSFQVLVDAAVARILRLKLALYGDVFELAETQPQVDLESGPTISHQEMLSAIGRDAVTLLSPPSPDLVPPPPTFEDNIVIFTDGRTGQACASCEPEPYIDPLALRDTIVRLYGPNATGQVNPALVASFTFDQLVEYLDTPPPLPTPTAVAGEGITTTPTLLHPVGAALQNADWVIFATLNPTSELPQSDVVRRFLAERADALRDPRLIVLAYSAPYYFDATEISKLDAYYVAYSRIEPFIEATIRTLFGEFTPVGTPPVSVTGINYDLGTQTSPDPSQTIKLSYYVSKREEEGEPTPEPTEEGESTPEPLQPRIGDELRLRSGVIVDHNDHPVPDGTPVQFIFTYPQEGLEHSIVEPTQGGVAETALVLGRTGQLDISLQADPVPRTVVLQITIPEGEQPVTIVTIMPTPTPTAKVPTSTPTREPEPEPVDTPTATVIPLKEEEEPPTSHKSAGGGELALALAVALLIGGLGYSVVRLNNESVSTGLRLALWCVIGGLGLYIAYVLGFPGVSWLQERAGAWATGWIALLGGLIPIVVVGVTSLQRWLTHRPSSERF